MSADSRGRRELAARIRPPREDLLRLHSAVITAVTGTTYTVRLSGSAAETPGVKAYAGARLLVDDVVEALFVGPDPRIVGKLGAPLVGDTGWIELVGFVNGASAYSTGLGASWTPRYRKISGIVYMEGLVNAGTTATVTVCTLPAGFRPGTGAKMVGMMSQGPSVRRMDIDAGGGMTFREVVGTASTGWHNIGCSFPQEN